MAFYYNYGQSGKAPRIESKELSILYTDACVDAYQIFHETEVIGGVGNLASVNAHMNEEVSVDPAVYNALEEIDDAGAMTVLYLAPVYDLYRGIFGA